MPYPFNYFSSLFQVRKAFANRKQLNWFQMIFTSLFLLSLTLIPVAVQNAELQTYPLTTFVSDVFDPLSDEVMADLKENGAFSQGEFTYQNNSKVFENKSGQVILGQHEDAEYGAALTLHFDKKALIILKEKTSYDSLPSHQSREHPGQKETH